MDRHGILDAALLAEWKYARCPEREFELGHRPMEQLLDRMRGLIDDAYFALVILLVGGWP